MFLETRTAPVRSVKLAIRFYRQGGPTYIATAGLLSGNCYASSSSWDQNNSDLPSSNQTLNAG